MPTGGFIFRGAILAAQLTLRTPQKISHFRFDDYAFHAIELFGRLAAPADAVRGDGIEFNVSFKAAPIVELQIRSFSERAGNIACGSSHPLRPLPLAFGSNEGSVLGRLRRDVHPFGAQNISINRDAIFFARGLRDPNVFGWRGGLSGLLRRGLRLLGPAARTNQSGKHCRTEQSAKSHILDSVQKSSLTHRLDSHSWAFTLSACIVFCRPLSTSSRAPAEARPYLRVQIAVPNARSAPTAP
jgi:hypothetical protein